MIDFIETTKRHAGLMLTLLILGYIVSLVLLQLLASLADDLPSLGNEPQVSTQGIPSVSGNPAGGCSVIDSITICPESVEHPK